MRNLVKLLFIVAIVAVAGYFLQDFWRPQSRQAYEPPSSTAVGTAGRVDTEKARAIGAEIGEKTAIATERMKEGAHDAAITTKIKAKMALDELVKARSIDVSTEESTVTLSGTVGSAAEHDRAVSLAKETAGVDTVFDRLVTR